MRNQKAGGRSTAEIREECGHYFDMKSRGSWHGVVGFRKKRQKYMIIQSTPSKAEEQKKKLHDLYPCEASSGMEELEIEKSGMSLGGSHTKNPLNFH